MEITPGCTCSQCRRLRELAQKRSRKRRPPASPDPHFNARLEKARPGEPDWGADEDDSGSSPEDSLGRMTDPGRNGGMRWFRPLDMEAREERWARNVPRLRYGWRELAGPQPQVDHGDRQAALIYLLKLEQAREQGGWNSSEAAGLYKAIRVWRARATGRDPRYELIGNKSTGLDKQQTANLRDAKIIQRMMDRLTRGRMDGD